MLHLAFSSHSPVLLCTAPRSSVVKTNTCLRFRTSGRGPGAISEAKRQVRQGCAVCASDKAISPSSRRPTVGLKPHRLQPASQQPPSPVCPSATSSLRFHQCQLPWLTCSSDLLHRTVDGSPRCLEPGRHAQPLPSPSLPPVGRRILPLPLPPAASSFFSPTHFRRARVC